MSIPKGSLCSSFGPNTLTGIFAVGFVPNVEDHHRLLVYLSIALLSRGIFRLQEIRWTMKPICGIHEDQKMVSRHNNVEVAAFAESKHKSSPLKPASFYQAWKATFNQSVFEPATIPRTGIAS